VATDRKNGAQAQAPDAIDQVIAQSQSVAMQQINITIDSTKRPAILAIPQDITDGEIAELAGWLLTGLLQAKRAERAKGAASRILVPAGAIRPT
jgi:hypothetical protein